MDEAVVEISTDKVDSDVFIEVSGILVEKNLKISSRRGWTNHCYY